MSNLDHNMLALIERLGSENEEARRQALAGLANFPFDVIKGHLLNALADESWRVRKESVEILVANADQDRSLVAELTRLLRSQDNAGLRNSAVETLEKLGEMSVSALCELAGDSDHDVRKFALDILGNIGDRSAIPVLINSLDDVDTNVKAAAAENLGKIGDASALPPLLEALVRSDLWLKFVILEAIARIGKPVPMEILAPLASESLLKKAIFDCLASIGGTEVIPLLMSGLKDSPKSVREAAVTGIYKVRKRLPLEIAYGVVDQQLLQLRNSPEIEALIALVETTDKSLFEALLRILAIIGDERTAPMFVKACQDERLRGTCVEAFRSMGDHGKDYLMKTFPNAAPAARCLIAFLFGELGMVESVDFLRIGMRDIDPGLRLEAVVSAGKILSRELIDDIAQLIDDLDPEVHDGALNALMRLAVADRMRVSHICLQFASSESPEKRRDAALLLPAVGDSERLYLLVNDENPLVRRAAVHSLAKLRSDASTGHLVMAMMDEDRDVRIAASSALGEIGSEEVVEPLILAIRDDDPWVQCAALKSLQLLRSEKALQSISELIETAEGPVLISALRTVALIAGEKGLDTVFKALESGDAEVVKVALEILAESADDRILNYCSQFLAHPQWDVRISFVKAVASSMDKKALPFLGLALKTESDPLVKGQILESMGRLR